MSHPRQPQRRPWSALPFVVLALLVPGLALAHDFWIEPSMFRPAVGGDVTAALRVGQRLEGEPLPRLPALIDRFFVKGMATASPIEGVAGADPAGAARITAPGPHWLAYQSHPYPVRLEARAFEDYLREEGLEQIIEARAKRGQSAAAGRERFHRCAKSLLNAGNEPPGARQQAFVGESLGLTLELLPQSDPDALLPGGDLPLTLRFRGQPAAGVLVVAIGKQDPERAVAARTDASGRVTLRLAHPGFWLVKAVYMEPAPPQTGVDWESWWASLTFDLKAARK